MLFKLDTPSQPIFRGTVIPLARTGNPNPQPKAENRRDNLSGNLNCVLGDRLARSSSIFQAQPQFAMGALGPQPLGQFPFLACLPKKGQRPHLLGGRKIRRCTQLVSRVSQEPPLQRRSQRRKPDNLNGQERRGIVSGGPASAAHRTARQQKLWRQPRYLRLPPSLLVAGQRGHVRQVFSQLRIPTFQQRQQFVPYAVAGKGKVAVR